MLDCLAHAEIFDPKIAKHPGKRRVEGWLMTHDNIISQNTIAESTENPATMRFNQAQQYIEGGFSVFPIGKLKKPAVSEWKPYQTEVAIEAELEKWFIENENPGIAIVCGAAEKKPIVLDFEYESVFISWCKILYSKGKKELIETLPIVKTPGGGIHVYVRLDRTPPAGEQLAKRLIDGKEDLLIETRGTGHYVVAPGSAAHCHPDNKQYELYRGCIADTPIISEEDFALFIDTAKSFNEMPEPKVHSRVNEGVNYKPWESPTVRDYNESKEIALVLADSGFKLVRTDGVETYWQKPRSSDGGHHVTFNKDDDGKIRCFSGTCPPFEQDKTYSGFETFALLKHEGDKKDAEAELKAEGFGLDLWPEPAEMEVATPIAPSMQAEMLPEPLRNYCVDISKRMQVPVEGIAISTIVSISSVVGAGCSIRSEKYGDFTVIPNLWGMLVGRPGVVLKSPTLTKGMNPLKTLQKKAREKFLIEMSEYRKAQEEYDLKLDRLKRQLKNSKSKESDAIATFRTGKMLLQEPVIPIQKRYFTNEASTQKITEILAGNPRGILKFHDELAGFIARLDQEREERGYYLTAWNGDGSYDDDKIGRGSTSAPNLCISMLGGIQPDMLQSVLLQAFSKKGIKPAASDGFIPRFQLAVWPEEPIRGCVDEPPDQAAQMRVQEIFDRLDCMDFEAFGAKTDSAGAIPCFQFAPDAQAEYGPWLIKLEAKIREEKLSVMQEHLSKYRSLLPSLALLFHLIEIADVPTLEGIEIGVPGISLRSFKLAEAWCDLLEQHARKIYSLINAAPIKPAAELIERIKAAELKDGFSLREIQRHGWRFLTDNETIARALNELVNAGWIWELKSERSFGHPEAISYLINPKISKK